MNTVLRLLERQRTTRKNQFSTRKIRKEDIEIIKASILKTADASNRQSYSVIILDKNQVNTLGLAGDMVLIFCIDFYRLHRCSELLDCDFDSQYMMQFTTALIDISMLAQSSILAANSLGIDTLITNEIYHNKLEKAFDKLNIPQNYVLPMIAVCLGYSKTDNRKQKGRIDLNHIFHDNQYKKPSDNEVMRIIEEYDDEKRNIGLIENWKEKGYKHYLEWFFNKWSPVIGSRIESNAFVEVLEKHKIV
ncbi:hypothetical protein R9X47_13660 [Wukongibacter baidiensis]|uniref:hypothetical protein n=1 Tax=Wukongibacter baidiensis TaxID=1723361 RepID=UPI003D7F718B